MASSQYIQSTNSFFQKRFSGPLLTRTHRSFFFVSGKVPFSWTGEYVACPRSNCVSSQRIWALLFPSPSPAVEILSGINNYPCSPLRRCSLRFPEEDDPELRKPKNPQGTAGFSIYRGINLILSLDVDVFDPTEMPEILPLAAAPPLMKRKKMPARNAIKVRNLYDTAHSCC